MYTRVVTVQIQLDKVDEAITIYQSIEPLWKQQQGFQGAQLLIDRTTGKGISLSTWETRADLETTEASGWYQEQVAKFATVFSGPPVREIYEVGVHMLAAKERGGT